MRTKRLKMAETIKTKGMDKEYCEDWYQMYQIKINRITYDNLEF